MTAIKERKPEAAAVSITLEVARRTKGWSLRQAEKESKVSNGYISQIEQGLVLPSPDVLLKLAEAYSIPYDALLVEAGYLHPESASEPASRIPAWMYAAAEVLEPEDWERAQTYFHVLRLEKEKKKRR